MKEPYKKVHILTGGRDLILLHKHGGTFLYSFFWVIPWRLYFMCWRFGTLCSIFIGGVSSISLPACTTYKDGTDRVFRNVST